MDPKAQGQPQDYSGKKVSGVFSTQSVEKIGTGATTRKTISKTFWFAQELDSGEIEIQPLNTNYVPAGSKQQVDKDDFLQRFSPEPEFYVKTVYPKMQELNKTVSRAEALRKKGANYSAEFEYETALAVDEENVKANFGLGLTYMSRGETAKANDIFGRLVKLDAAFEAEHKHLFNEFGINLRKSGMQDQAVEYYSRALEMTADDENLHYNMARAFFEKGRFDDCAEHLKKSIELNPGHDEAKRFYEWLKDKGKI